MLSRYASSTAGERAREVHRRLWVGADGSVLAIGGATGEPTPLRPTALVQALTLPTGREPH